MGEIKEAVKGEATPLLEREPEQRVLDEACADAAEGRGSVVVVAGAAGVGKTRLLAAAGAEARDRSMRVLSAAGRERERPHSFGVTLQLLDHHLRQLPPDERNRLLSGPARMAAPLLANGAREAIPAGEAFAVFHGLHRLCANLAEDAPIALVVDDAQWADEPSLRFLLYLAQRVEDLPIALIVGVGVEQGAGAHELLDELSLHTSTSILPLRELSEAAVSAWVRAEFLQGASDEFCRACYQTTRGNPFLVAELLDELATREVAPTARDAQVVPGVVPDTVSRAMLGRIRRAGPGAAELAAAVAVLGDRAELRHAAALAGLEATQAAAAADVLVDARILARSDRLTFVHPIVRTAVYADRPPAERAEAHLLAATMLRDEGADPEHVAGQLVPAPRRGSAWVVDALFGGAAHARARGVPSAAVTYLRRALEEPPAPASKPQLMLELGRAEVAAGKPEAKDRLAAAVRLIDEPGDRARAALEAGWALYSEGRPEDAADAFAQGAEGLGDADPDLRVQLEVARAASRRLVGSARDGDDDELRLDLAGVGPGSVELVLAYRAFEGTLTGRHREEVVGDARDALHGREEAESEAAEGLGYYLATFALVAGGELTAAERFLSAGVEHARSRGSVLGFATASFLRSQSRLRYGDLDGALADARTALSARRYGWKLGLLGAHAVVINALIEKDDLDGAGEEVAAASEAALAGDDLAQGMYLAARGHWHLHRGAPEEALADFEAVGERERTLRASNPAVLSWRSGAALALSKLGEAETAAGLAHEELGMGRAFGSAGQLGRTLHALGSLQENGRRLEVLGEAVQALDRSEARLDLARALVDYGAALRRARKRAKAREPLRRGLDLAERCGAAALGQRARDELVTAGARPRRAALTGVEALTERERQVVDLAAQGMSNKDIAEALFVTLKTVEWHLHHAYRKLGVSSRTELTEILTPRQ